MADLTDQQKQDFLRPRSLRDKLNTKPQEFDEDKFRQKFENPEDKWSKKVESEEDIIKQERNPIFNIVIAALFLGGNGFLLYKVYNYFKDKKIKEDLEQQFNPEQLIQEQKQQQTNQGKQQGNNQKKEDFENINQIIHQIRIKTGQDLDFELAEKLLLEVDKKQKGYHLILKELSRNNYAQIQDLQSQIIELQQEQQGSSKEKIEKISKKLQEKQDKIAETGNKCVKFIDQYLEYKPDQHEIYYLKAAVLKDINQVDQGLQTLDEAIMIDPYFITPLIIKGQFLKEIGLYNDSLECYKKAITVQPEQSDGYINAAFLLYNIEQVESAMQFLDIAIKLEPKYSPYRQQFLQKIQLKQKEQQQRELNKNQ